MRIKTIYDRLEPGFKSSLQKNARQYSSAKRLKYVLMSKTSWHDLTISDVSDMSIYCDIPTYKLSATDFMYGNSIITK
ncbi:MAG: hypothetical protein H8E55_42370 [Pelagibacterales bacterium]|nr:hypothetical protein [Pelagibacterales bacterium]